MRGIIYLLSAAALLGVAAIPSNAAAQNADWSVCASDESSEDARRQQIEACTRGIESGQFAGVNLAPWLVNRAITWAAVGDQTRALADYSAALDLLHGEGSTDDQRAFVLTYRGDAYAAANDRARALADYQEAVRLSPQNQAAASRLAALTAN